MINRFRMKENMKHTCLRAFGETFDDNALYNLIDRINLEIKNNPGQITVRAASENNILKELTNKKILKTMKDIRTIGSTSKVEKVKVMWGRGIETGSLQTVIECIGSDSIIVNDTMKKANIDNAEPGLYCVLKQLYTSNHMYDAYQEDVKFDTQQAIHIVFFRITK